MVERRKIGDEKEARACLRAVAKSGQPRRAWAREHGIDGRSLRGWETKLSSRPSPARSKPPSPEMIELVPASATVAPPRYVVRVGDGMIEVGDDFNDTTLRRLIAVIRAC